MQTTEQLQEGDLELLRHASEGYRKLKAEIGKVLLGQDEIVRQLLAAIFSQGHVLIIGVPGLGKTLLVKTSRRCWGGTSSGSSSPPT